MVIFKGTVLIVASTNPEDVTRVRTSNSVGSNTSQNVIILVLSGLLPFEGNEAIQTATLQVCKSVGSFPKNCILHALSQKIKIAVLFMERNSQHLFKVSRLQPEGKI